MTKLSVLCFYYRIFEISPGFTTQLRFVGALVIAWWITFEIVAIVQCIPVRANWDPAVDGVCIDTFAFFIGQAVPNIALDIIILVLPIKPLWKLHVRKPQKVLLLTVFILGYL